MVPETIDARDVIAAGYNKYNISFGTGLSKVMGKVFRIGHLGDMNEGMVLTALSLSEMSLRDAGYPVELGLGVAAAQSWFLEAQEATLRQAAE
jgi:alanine-glyoxylate transaminase/serine-glyoxylate transaminase/serine-pyruvate transaminase